VLAAALGASLLLPPLRSHLARGDAGPPPRTRDLLARPAVRLSLLAVGSSFVVSFSLVPNLSAYFQLNGGFPRARLGLLYLGGGAVTFPTMRAAGWLVDRHGAPRVAAGATALYVAVLAALGFAVPGTPVPLLFVGFMLANSTRNVAAGALTTRVPAPAERARFTSAQSATQHLAASAGAVLSTALLTETPGGALAGMPRVVALVLPLAVVLPLLLARIRALLPTSPTVHNLPGEALGREHT